MHTLTWEGKRRFTALTPDGREGRFDTPAEYGGEGWVSEIVAGAEPEPDRPAAQSFWFWVHEAYCANPPFIDRLIDAGHLWEAMMCATEIGDAVEGMAPVLARLAASDDKDVSARARGWLEDYYA